MSTPRGGGGSSRGVDRGRATSRGRGRGNGASTGDRPTQQVYTPGARGRGRGSGAPNTMRGSFRGTSRGGHSSLKSHGSVAPAQATFGDTNSTPFDSKDYAKRLEFIRERRPKLREQFIKEGRMNPEGQMRLEDSVSLVGICTDMCPEFERVRRIVEDDVKRPECTAETQHLPRRQRIPDESRMVKAYARSAAGMDVELVSEIRSPKTCLNTVNYLMQRLDNDDFDFLHGWIWDRTRAIRKDLRTQQVKSTSDIAIYLECLERSARFLLLSTHHMGRTTKDDYSHQQDIEQLNATLMSLKERYVDNRRIGNPSQNEAEFYAYRLILAPIYTKTQLENELHALPLDLRNNSRIQVAIQIFRMLQSIIFQKSQYFVQAQTNWKRFWDLVRSPSVSYLMACAAEVSFQRIRHVVLDTLWRVYRIGTSAKPKTVDTWTTNRLKDVLGLDTDKEAVELCESFGFHFSVNATGQTFLDICKKGYARTALSKPDELKPQTFSQRIVEEKRYNRALSAVVNGQSVRDAQKSGLTSAANGVHDDGISLFVPEGQTPIQNVFNQAKTTPSDATKLSPAANPFIPKANPTPDVAVQSNPFLKAQQAAAQPTSTAPVSQSSMFTSSAITAAPTSAFATSKPFINPFLPNNTPAPAAPAPATSITATPSTKTPFLPSESATPTGPLAGFTSKAPSSTTNPFLPRKSVTPTTNFPTSTPTAPSSTPNLFSQASQAGQQQASAVAATTPLFNFTPSPSTSQPSSFTPAGTPSILFQTPTPSEEGTRKAAEEEKRRKAEAEAQAEVQRKRAQEEEQRQLREAAQRAEQQRQEVERQRMQAVEEARRTAAREARLRQEKEEQDRLARIRTRESAWDSLAEEIMCNTDEALLMQFVQNEVSNTVESVIQRQKEERNQRLFEERKATVDQKHAERQIAINRWCLGRWVFKLEKKKKAQQARDRRRRLKELKERAQMTNDTDQDSSLQELSTNATNHQHDLRDTVPDAFRKPTVPASARRTKRTEERRRSHVTTNTGPATDQRQAELGLQTPADQATLTPVSMTNSFTSSGDYSEAYKKSKAPIDRTETDWFKLRAMGLDPRKHRKRSFGSSSGDDEKEEVEVKRLKTSASTLNSQDAPPSEQPRPAPSTFEDQLAQFRALQKSFRRSTGSPPQAVPTVTQADARGSFNGRASVMERARQIINASITNKSTTSDVQHDWGRSVPNLAHSTSVHRRACSTYTTATPKSDRPAYWNRPSRFVPRHLYGKGADAILAYRVEYGLSSPSSTRPNSTEPFAVSSPIPTQLSYKAAASSKPVTQIEEEYSETEEDQHSGDDDSVVVIDDEGDEEMSDPEDASGFDSGDMVPETQAGVDDNDSPTYEDKAGQGFGQVDQHDLQRPFEHSGPYYQQSYRQVNLEEVEYTQGYVNGNSFGHAHPQPDQYMQNKQFAQPAIGQVDDVGSDDLLEYDYSNEEGASGMDVVHDEADTEDAYEDDGDEEMDSQDAARALANFHQQQQRLHGKQAQVPASDDEAESESEEDDEDGEEGFDEEADEDDDDDEDDSEQPMQGGATEDDAIELSD